MPDAEQLLQHGVHGLAEARGVVGEQRRLHLIGAGCCGDHQARHLLVPCRVVCHRKEHSDGVRVRGTGRLGQSAASRHTGSVNAAQQLGHGCRLGGSPGHCAVDDVAPPGEAWMVVCGVGACVPALQAQMVKHGQRRETLENSPLKVRIAVIDLS